MKHLKYLSIVLSLSGLGIANTASAQECFRIIKFSLCNGRCRNVTQFSSNAILEDVGMMEFIEEPFNENDPIDLAQQNDFEYFNVD
jgi:hypothetical protein